MSDPTTAAIQRVVTTARTVARLRRELHEAERMLALATAKLERVLKQLDRKAGA